MAFGKKKEDLAGLPTFRGSTAQASKRQYTTTKKRIPYFIIQYEPSTEHPDLIRLIPGSYPREFPVGKGEDVTISTTTEPFVLFEEHFDGTMKKGCICSAGPLRDVKAKRKPCHGCDIFWATAATNAQGRFESTRMSRQRKYGFNVLDYGSYHRVEAINRTDGTVMINRRTNEPMYNVVKCKAGPTSHCEYCNAGKEIVASESRPWPINFTQLQILRDAAKKIGSSCKTCCGVNSIRPQCWYCDGCGEVAIDMTTTTLSQEDIEKITEGDEPFVCGCGKQGLVEAIECVNCTPHNAEPKRADIFDVDLSIQIVQVGDKKILQVMGWSEPRPVAAGFEELAKVLDLAAIFAPDPLERQAELFGINKIDAPAASVIPGHRAHPNAPQPAQGQAAQPVAAPARPYASPFKKPQV